MSRQIEILIAAILVTLIDAPAAHAGGAGACCTAAGICAPSVPASLCEDVLDGAYQGDGTTCDDVTCVPFGACCFGGATCTTEAEPACATAGGHYTGNGSSCGTLGVCAFTSGACCLGDGACVENIDIDECAALGGDYRGYSSACESVSCSGACSFADGACVETARDACAATFLGPDTACGDYAHPASSEVQTFAFDQNSIRAFAFEPFDTMGGTRRLEQATLELADVNVTRVFVLANLLDIPVESTVHEIEQLEFSFANLGLTDVALVDVDALIACTPLILGPGERCDYGGPLVYPAPFASSATDASTLAGFVADDEIGAELQGSGTVSVAIDPHEAFSEARISGTMRLVYEYTLVECPCDIDADGACGFEDLLLVISTWGNATTAGDIDGDGVIGFRDLLIVISGWGPCL